MLHFSVNNNLKVSQLKKTSRRISNLGVRDLGSNLGSAAFHLLLSRLLTSEE